MSGRAAGSGPGPGSRAQPNWAGGSGHRQGARRGRGGRGPGSHASPDPGPLLDPWASAGAGPAQDWGPTLPEPGVRARRHLELPSRARLAGLPGQGLTPTRWAWGALFWGPSACCQPESCGAQAALLPRLDLGAVGRPWGSLGGALHHLPRAGRLPAPGCTASVLPVVCKF